MTQHETDLYFLRAAYREAARSRDASTQNGAVLVRLGKSGYGCNDLHPKWADTPDRRERPGKYLWTEHAERAAIFDAASRGVDTGGATLYVCWAACADCARAIVFAGVRRVVRHWHPAMDARPDWAASCAVGDQMFAEAGVEVVTIREPLGVSIRFNGSMVEA